MKNYNTIEEILEDFKSRGLIGCHASEIFEKHSYLYHRVYRFAKKHDKVPSHIWDEIGILTSRGPSFRGDSDVIEWAKKHNIVGKKTHEISTKHIGRIYGYARQTGRKSSAIYQLIGVEFETERVYSSIDDIKVDLMEKGLIGKTVEEMNLFDGYRTAKNIHAYARENNLLLCDIYGLIGLKYSSKTEVVNGVAKTALVYKTVEHILEDLQDKGLVGKTIKEIVLYDNSKTYTRVVKFARRRGLDSKNLWSLLGVLPSEKEYHQDIPSFCSVEEIKSYLSKNGINHLELKELRVQHKKLYQEILEFAKRQGMARGVVWDLVGVNNAVKMLHSIEDVVALLVSNGLRKATKKEIRTYDNGSVYQAIYSYTSRNNIRLSSLWEMLGIVADYHTKRKRSD